MKRYLLPLALFVVLAAFLGVGLKLDPREVPSPLVNKPAPTFTLPTLADPELQFSLEQMKGQVWVLDFWASWCVPCLAEHPYVTAMAREAGVPVVGLNYKDKPEDAMRWLARHGDPYTNIAADRDGRVGIDFGVYGVPETFIIDKQGTIRHKQIGPITPDDLRDTLMPLLKQLNP